MTMSYLIIKIPKKNKLLNDEIVCWLTKKGTPPSPPPPRREIMVRPYLQLFSTDHESWFERTVELFYQQM